MQIEKTACALGETELEVLTDFSDEPELIDIDLVHGFGLSSTEVRRCHTRHVPVALSPIYWDRSYRSDGASQEARSTIHRRPRDTSRSIRSFCVSTVAPHSSKLA